MRVVKRYESSDGKVWKTKEQALKQDKLIAGIKAAYAHLKPRPKNDDAFCNGVGFIQHDPGAYDLAVSNIRKVAADYTQDERFLTCEVWLLIRGTEDCKSKLLSNAVGRLQRICPKTNREYGQAYYVTHPWEVRAPKEEITK